uniref:Large ribosomal subunit protein eL13 n=1 Tax=Ditylenchus dipsaci TaxID=166011 RepID=A0A915DNT1_9BILA
MAPKGNNVLPNAHFHKHWQRRIKTWFDQPARKVRRRQARVAKAAKICSETCSWLAPSCSSLSICPLQWKTASWQRITLEELKGAGLTKYEAMSIGIAVDFRRTNKSVEGLQNNIQRLKLYRSKLILFPKKLSAPKRETAVLKRSMKQHSRREKALPLTDELKNFPVYCHLRRVRADKRCRGKREKKAREAADEGLGAGAASGGRR